MTTRGIVVRPDTPDRAIPLRSVVLVVACDGAVLGGAGSARTAPGAQPPRTSAKGHKIHGFSHTNPEVLKTFPFDSLDAIASSSRAAWHQ
jgi:hypothetical protein